jgi:hypothetical protein
MLHGKRDLGQQFVARDQSLISQHVSHRQMMHTSRAGYAP